MSSANVLREIFQGPLLPDPGASGTIYLNDMSPVHCDLVSATAEARTLAVPSRAGAIISIGMKTDGGDITLTVTGGFNEDGDTTFTFSDVGQFAVFESFDVSGTITWRKISDYSTGSITPTEAALLDGVTAGTTLASKVVTTDANNSVTFAATATPASVATATGSAAATEIGATGGVGGDTTIATTGTGGVGSGFSYTGGAGGVATAAVTAATGGAGGAFLVTTGAGGAEAVATVTSTGGAGGAITYTSGAGGAVSGAVSGTATGGAGGLATLAGGVGGAVTATTGTNVGGAGGGVALTGGTGGAASAATDTGGIGGSITITSGNGGSGDTGGAAGTINLVTGTVGSGGSPAAGKVLIKLGGTERWGFYGTTVGVLTSLGAVPTNINATGTILPGGGVAITDVLNAWIDDATHGSGTVAHLIGNQTITTSSDIRIKKNIQPYQMACAAVKRAPRVVTFEYDHPDWGGDRAAPDDENARKWGPNARGTYVGFLAQETIEWAPWVVNAGAGKDCPKCSKGLPCEDETHPFWHVEYQHLVPMLTAALQEMIARVEKLEARLAG